jgi:hypothetical protein
MLLKSRYHVKSSVAVRTLVTLVVVIEVFGACLGAIGTISQVIFHPWDDVVLVLEALYCESAKLHFVRTAGAVAVLEVDHHP